MGGVGRAFVSGTVFVGVLLGFSSARSAQADPDISVVATATPAAVTLSRPASRAEDALVTLAGYLVHFKNDTPNSLNRIYFNAKVLNNGSDEAINFDSSNIPACTGFDTTVLSCQTTTSLKPGEEANFFVVVRAPASGTSINLVWTAGGSEGKGVGVGCCGTTQTTTTALVDPSTDITFTREAKSFVKSKGGTLFTGDRSVTSTFDKFTTKVIVAPFTSADYTIGSILETTVDPLDTIPDPLDTNCLNGGRLVKCFTSDVKLPDVTYSGASAGLLTFVLRIDSSVINPKTLIEAVQITHDGMPVYMCGYSGPTLVYPCITERKFYKNKSVPGWTRNSTRTLSGRSRATGTVSLTCSDARSV